MRHPPGTPARLTMDLDNPRDLDPAEGDTILTVAGTSAYVIHEARQVRSRVHPRRWRLDVIRLDPAEVQDPDYLLWRPPRGGLSVTPCHLG